MTTHPTPPAPETASLGRLVDAILPRLGRAGYRGDFAREAALGSLVAAYCRDRNLRVTEAAADALHFSGLPGTARRTRAEGAAEELDRDTLGPYWRTLRDAIGL